MSDKRDSAGSRVATAVIGAAAAFAARKLLFFGWKKITGKEPPEHPEDPQVALGEALIWGIVLGAGVHTAKLLATRATTSHRGDSDGPAAGGAPV